MSSRLAQARYASDAAQTVSAARLVPMLYDRLVVDLATAEDAMRRNDPALTGHRLGRAQEILLELHATLDLAVWPQGEPLSRLYLWLVGELMHARLDQTPERVEQCRLLLEPLRDAWHEVASGRASGAPHGETSGEWAGTTRAATGTAGTTRAPGATGAATGTTGAATGTAGRSGTAGASAPSAPAPAPSRGPVLSGRIINRPLGPVVGGHVAAQADQRTGQPAWQRAQAWPGQPAGQPAGQRIGAA
jgi:flagellar protein FliS